MTPRQFFQQSRLDPYFVANLSDTDIQALRADIAKWAKLGVWFDTPLGFMVSLMLFFGSIIALVAIMPFLKSIDPTGGVLVAPPAILLFVGVALASLHSPFRIFGQMEQALQPLRTHEKACHQALKLVTESAMCRAYRDQVLAHPRELVLADLPPMQRLYDEEQTPARMLSAEQACKAVHGLASLPGALP